MTASPGQGTPPPGADEQRCENCQGTDTTYQAMSGGREYWCRTCEEAFPYPEDGGRPRRVQMLADGRFDDLRAEMRAELSRRAEEARDA